MSTFPLTSEDVAAEPYMHVAEGETLIITEDVPWHLQYMSIDGTLIIDGTTFFTQGGGRLPIVWDTIINLTGTLRVINGSQFGGYYTVYMSSGSLLEVNDSEMGSDWANSGSIIYMRRGVVTASNSTLFARCSLIDARGGSIELTDTKAHHVRVYEDHPFMKISDGTELSLIGCNLSMEMSVIEATEVGNITISGGEVRSRGLDILNVDGSPSLTVSEMAMHKGRNGIIANNVGKVTIEDLWMEDMSDCPCHLSWAGEVTVDGLSIKDCGNAGLKIINCTDVTITDLDVSGVSGDGIGLMTEHSTPLTASGIDVRYARTGVFTIYTDDLSMRDVSVDWCRYYGVRLSYCDGVDLRSVSATGAGIDGLYSGWCRGLKVEDATFDRAGECGAYLTHTTASLTNVTARNCGQHGVWTAVQSTFLVGCDLSYNVLNGFQSLDQGGAGLTDCIVEGNGEDGIEFVATTGPFVKECSVNDNLGVGVRVHYQTRNADVRDCDIEGNGWGVVLNGPSNVSLGSSVTVRETYIHNNTRGGALNWLDNSSDLDARYCWWGNNTGPYNETRNADGTGDLVQGGVQFKPWLKLGNLPPVIEGPSDLTVVEEDVGLFFYNASDWDDDPNRIEFGLEGAPRNVTVGDSSGTLVISPNDAEVGTHSFFLTATDARGAQGRLRIHLTVVPWNDPPLMRVPEDGISLGDDDFVNVQLHADDHDNEPWELSWTLLSGPDFLRIRDDGVLEGVTSWMERGSHNITVRVVDAAGGVDTEIISVHVLPHFEHIHISGLSTTTAFEGERFSSDILMTCDEEADLAWRMVTNASWLALAESERRMQGLPAPAHVGIAAVELTVTDQFGNLETFQAIIEVVAVNDPPRWVHLPDEVTVRSGSWDIDLSKFVIDEDDPLRSLVFLYEEPDRLLGIQGSFLIGDFNEGDQDRQITVIVRDPHGATDEANLTIRVDIPTEPEPTYTVSTLFPWVVVAILATLAGGAFLTQRERKSREREGAD